MRTGPCVEGWLGREDLLSLLEKGSQIAGLDVRKARRVRERLRSVIASHSFITDTRLKPDDQYGVYVTHLWLASPKRQVVECAFTCEIYGLGGADEKVGCGDDIEERRLSRVRNWKPESNGEVVGCIAKGDREEAVKTKEELCATVIVCYLKVSR